MEPIGERGHIIAWPEGGKDMQERERVKETALIRAPRGPAARPPDIRK
jgi:hypothetical protein